MRAKSKIMFCIRTATTSFNTVNILVQKFMCHRTNKIVKKKTETKIFPIIWERFQADTPAETIELQTYFRIKSVAYL